MYPLHPFNSELLANPSVFLDEPTSGLDPGLDRKMLLLLRKLADAGHTMGTMWMMARVRGGRRPSEPPSPKASSSGGSGKALPARSAYCVCPGRVTFKAG